MAKGVFWDNEVLTAKGLGAMAKMALSDGILNGCAMSLSTGTLIIGAGHIIISGRVVHLDGSDSVDLSSASGTVYITVELNISSGDITIGYSAAAPESSSDINLSGTEYTGWIAAVNLTSNTIEERASASCAYPIGSIYMSVTLVDPAALFGGTWERIQNRFLLGASNTYVNGSTGGEETHTLTVDEMPAHSHTYQTDPYSTQGGSGSSYVGSSTSKELTTGETGGGQPHNNMPPYLSVYMWKRTA